MNDKFHMTVAQNVFWAKRNIVDYIWKSARLEGINITFPQTYAIIEKATVSSVSVDDILKITNLKHAWQLLFDTINEPLNLDLICAFHKEVAKDEAIEWGKLRTGNVFISGTDFIPPIPNPNKVKSELNELLKIENSTERAIEIMLWGMKSQLFWDGNKRNSMLVANKIMIENGCGVISVPNDKLEIFNTVLSDFYTNDTLQKAKAFIFCNCISGTNFSQENSIEAEPFEEPDNEPEM